MRFLVDASAGVHLARRLHGLGHDILFARDLGPDPGDDALLEIAAREKRVVITVDKNFGRGIILGHAPNAGIVFIPDISIERRVLIVQSLVSLHKKDLLSGCWVIYKRGRIRIHPRGTAKIAMAEDFSNLLPLARDVRCPHCGGRALYLSNLTRRVFKRDAKAAMGWLRRAPFPSSFGPATMKSTWWDLQWLPHDARRGKPGVLDCAECATRVAGDLDWPHDAWYQVEVAGQKFWAPDHDLFALVREYLEAGARKDFLAGLHPDAAAFLRKLPRKLVAPEVRAEALAQIDVFLKDDSRRSRARRR